MEKRRMGLSEEVKKATNLVLDTFEINGISKSAGASACVNILFTILRRIGISEDSLHGVVNALEEVLKECDGHVSRVFLNEDKDK